MAAKGGSTVSEQEASVVADYTESVVPTSARRSVVYLLLVRPVAGLRNAGLLPGYSKIDELPESISSAPGHA